MGNGVSFKRLRELYFNLPILKKNFLQFHKTAPEKPTIYWQSKPTNPSYLYHMSLNASSNTLTLSSHL